MTPAHCSEKQPAPRADDRTFVVDSNATLDTECRYAADGHITFTIPVTRYVAPVDDLGFLVDPPQVLADEGVVSRVATLTISAWDVDAAGAQHPDKEPEDDRVYFNNVDIGSLTGVNRGWSSTEIAAPIELVKFPDLAPLGFAPTPALNAVRIEIDRGNATAQRVWCTAVDWAALRIRAMSPSVLIHGNNSDGGFFETQGFVAELDSRLIPSDNSITMETASIDNHAAQLATLLPRIVRRFGVDSIHLIAHSKGGLDSRAFLAASYHIPTAAGGPFDVLSLTTLSTPHKGTALADLVVAQAQQAVFQGNLVGSLAQTVAKISPLKGCVQEADEGRRDLTTDAMMEFNIRNVRHLPSRTKYYAISGDADRNESNHIEYAEDAVAALTIEDPSCLGAIASVSTDAAAFLVDRLAYRFLRNTAAVRVKPIISLGTVIFVKISVLLDGGDLNDTLVTVGSAEGESPPFEPIMSFVGPGVGRNHSTIADAGVASVVLAFLQDTDRSIGDLR